MRTVCWTAGFAAVPQKRRQPQQQPPLARAVSGNGQYGHEHRGGRPARGRRPAPRGAPRPFGGCSSGRRGGSPAHGGLRRSRLQPEAGHPFARSPRWCGRSRPGGDGVLRPRQRSSRQPGSFQALQVPQALRTPQRREGRARRGRRDAVDASHHALPGRPPAKLTFAARHTGKRDRGGSSGDCDRRTTRTGGWRSGAPSWSPASRRGRRRYVARAGGGALAEGVETLLAVLQVPAEGVLGAPRGARAGRTRGSAKSARCAPRIAANAVASLLRRVREGARAGRPHRAARSAYALPMAGTTSAGRGHCGTAAHSPVLARRAAGLLYLFKGYCSRGRCLVSLRARGVVRTGRGRNRRAV